MAVLLHTRVRVSDLDRSIDWYCKHLGFEVLSRTDKSPRAITSLTSSCRATTTHSSLPGRPSMC